MLPSSLQELIMALAKLPGVGRKTATRLAFHLLKSGRQESEHLAKTIMRVQNEVKLCRQCYNFSQEEICPICRDSKRNQNVICVVEDAQNIVLIEKTNEYRGLYHVLGGIISPLDGVGPEDLRIKELIQRLTGVQEVILALNPSTEGEATSIYLARLIKPLGVRITRLARGVPLGSTLEFVDELTLSKAIQTRSDI